MRRQFRFNLIVVDPQADFFGGQEGIATKITSSRQSTPTGRSVRAEAVSALRRVSEWA